MYRSLLPGDLFADVAKDRLNVRVGPTTRSGAASRCRWREYRAVHGPLTGGLR
jgi:hypothetical protein